MCDICFGVVLFEDLEKGGVFFYCFLWGIVEGGFLKVLGTFSWLEKVLGCYIIKDCVYTWLLR